MQRQKHRSFPVLGNKNNCSKIRTYETRQRAKSLICCVLYKDAATHPHSNNFFQQISDLMMILLRHCATNNDIH